MSIVKHFPKTAVQTKKANREGIFCFKNGELYSILTKMVTLAILSKQTILLNTNQNKLFYIVSRKEINQKVLTQIAPPSPVRARCKVKT